MKRLLSIVVSVLLLIGLAAPATAAPVDRPITKADVVAYASRLDPNKNVLWGYGYPVEDASSAAYYSGFNRPYLSNTTKTPDKSYSGYVWNARTGYAGVIYIGTANTISYLPYLMTHEYMHTYEWRYVNGYSKTATTNTNFGALGKFQSLGKTEYHPADYKHPATEYLADCMMMWRMRLPLVFGPTTQARYGCPNYALYSLGVQIVNTEDRVG